MTEPLVVRMSDLRASMEAALVGIERALGAEVSVDADYYWHLQVEAAFDMSTEPTEFTVGSLSDDLADLGESQPDSAGSEWHDLLHLIGVLRALELAARP